MVTLRFSDKGSGSESLEYATSASIAKVQSREEAAIRWTFKFKADVQMKIADKEIQQPSQIGDWLVCKRPSGALILRFRGCGGSEGPTMEELRKLVDEMAATSGDALGFLGAPLHSSSSEVYATGTLSSEAQHLASTFRKMLEQVACIDSTPFKKLTGT